MTSLALRFKLRAGEVHRVIVEAIVNGTSTATQIYKVTLGKFIEDAKNVKCEDLISANVSLKFLKWAKSSKNHCGRVYF